MTDNWFSDVKEETKEIMDTTEIIKKATQKTAPVAGESENSPTTEDKTSDTADTTIITTPMPAIQTITRKNPANTSDGGCPAVQIGDTTSPCFDELDSDNSFGGPKRNTTTGGPDHGKKVLICFANWGIYG